MDTNYQIPTEDNILEKLGRAKAFAKGIKNFLPKNNSLKALDFGCGSGILSFELKDAFENITLVDISEDMIQSVHKLVAENNINNFNPLCINVLDDYNKIDKPDVIYSSMVFHHIIDIENAFKIFNDLLNQDGLLCIADVVKEDGSFHSHVANYDGHNGFDKVELSELLHKQGFKEVFYEEVFVMEKEVENIVRKFPLFLMIAQKR